MGQTTVVQKEEEDEEEKKKKDMPSHLAEDSSLPGCCVLN